MPVLTCPCCEESIPDASGVFVCPMCARSLYANGRQVRTATAEDLKALSPGEITALRQARPAIWRNDVRAKHARIVGAK